MIQASRCAAALTNIKASRAWQKPNGQAVPWSL
jgi:hypothetical protein